MVAFKLQLLLVDTKQLWVARRLQIQTLHRFQGQPVVLVDAEDLAVGLDRLVSVFDLLFVDLGHHQQQRQSLHPIGKLRSRLFVAANQLHEAVDLRRQPL